MKLQTLVEIKGRKCHYCPLMTRLPFEKGRIFDMATRDHRVPRSAGGSNTIDNIVVACYTCNCLKGNMSEEEFLKSPLLKKRIDDIVNKRNKIKSIKKLRADAGYRTTKSLRHKERNARILSERLGIPIEQILAEWDNREKVRLNSILGNQ